LIPDNIKKKTGVAPSALQAAPGQSPSFGVQPQAVGEPGERILQIPLEKIHTNKFQPRQHFDHAEIEELAKSIKEHGILQPLTVTQEGDSYNLIAGERRLRAARFLELKTVPAIVRKAQDQQRLELALIENIQRQDLNLVEEAAAYLRLTEEFHLSHDDVAKRVGKSRATVTNALRILNLPQEIKDAVLNRKISPSHARSIAALLDPKDQLDLFHKIVNEHLNVREVEREAKKVVVEKHLRKVSFDPVVEDMIEQLRAALGTKVSISKKGERGSIMINFFSEEELNNIVKKITD
ncbi:ParB/RepB/Spo0J family partition protein, partial [Candidatus Uhrbacteria bacterium]|nr:ParB/RepB/Spo0J family partition protein [Candidatus Uhrbacteria bacterium]